MTYIAMTEVVDGAAVLAEYDTVRRWAPRSSHY